MQEMILSIHTIYIHKEKYTLTIQQVPRATPSPIGRNIYGFGGSVCRSVLHSALNFVLCSAAYLFDCIGYNTIKDDYEEYTCRRETEILFTRQEHLAQNKSNRDQHDILDINRDR